MENCESAIRKMQKQVSDLEPKLQQNPDLKARVDVASSELKNIIGDASSPNMGSDEANTGLAAALRVVESSDRSVPAQALEVYGQASAAAKVALVKWSDFKSKRLPELNHQLEAAGLPGFAVAQIEKEVEESESQ